MFPELESIKARRLRLGIKQKELAEMSNVSQSLIAKIENKGIEISYSLAKKIFLTLEKLEHHSEKKCSNVMSKKLIYIRKNDSIAKASDIMKKNSIDQLPVLEGNRAVGSISESLIFDKILTSSKNKILNLKVMEIMGEPFPIVNEELPLSVIMPMLKSTSAILVSKNSKIVGIITKSNLI